MKTLLTILFLIILKATLFAQNSYKEILLKDRHYLYTNPERPYNVYDEYDEVSIDKIPEIKEKIVNYYRKTFEVNDTFNFPVDSKVFIDTITERRLLYSEEFRKKDNPLEWRYLHFRKDQIADEFNNKDLITYYSPKESKILFYKIISIDITSNVIIMDENLNIIEWHSLGVR